MDPKIYTFVEREIQLLPWNQQNIDIKMVGMSHSTDLNYTEKSKFMTENNGPKT